MSAQLTHTVVVDDAVDKDDGKEEYDVDLLTYSESMVGKDTTT